MRIDRNIIANNPDKDLLIEIINNNFKQNELIDFWNKLNKNIIIKENEKRCPSFIFFCKNSEITKDNPEGILMYYNVKTEWFVINYYKIWSIFELKFKLNRQSINEFVADMVFKTYKLKVVTTNFFTVTYAFVVFKTYKLKVVTTKKQKII